MKRFPFFVAVLAIVGALLACGSSSATNTGTTTGSTPGSTAQTASHFKVGDTVTVGNTWKVVVNTFATNAGGSYDAPKKGGFVVVNISLTNISKDEQNVSSLLDFKFKGTDGTEYNDIYLSTASPSPNGKVAAGDVTKGDLAYDVPTDQKAFTLSFAPDITSSGQSIWDLSL